MPKWIKIFIIHYIILPFIPYNEVTKTFLVFLFCLIFIVFGILIHKFKGIDDFPSLILLLRLLLIVCGLMLFSLLLDKFQNQLFLINISERTLIYIILLLIIISFIFIMADFLIRLVNKLTDPREEKGIFNKIESMTTLLGALLVPFLLPNIFFGFSYKLVLSSLYTIELTNFQSYYLSFVINYALPISNRDVLDIIDKINTGTLLGYLQIIHITFTKIIDLTIIALVIKYVNNIIVSKKTIL
jgi:hypothetical protein